MNTVKKGDRLEEKIFQLFDSEISNGRFFTQKEFCRIYAKKGYYSNDRKKDIIFDISIEIFLPDQDTYSMLVLIECKNYNHKVPVDDVEEFFMKTQQISGGNLKAIVVSNNAFQEGAFEFSRSKGIGLLRYYDKSNLDWVLTRSPSGLVTSNYGINERSNAYEGLHAELFESTYFDCYCFVEDQYSNSLKTFIFTLIKFGADRKLRKSFSAIEAADKKLPWLVTFKNASDIELLCDSILDEVGYKFGEVPLDKICQILNKKNNLEVKYNYPLKNGVLGRITFNPPEIHIDDRQCENAARLRFTLAHELGHLLLGHSKYMSGEQCHESAIDLDNPAEVGIKDIMRMEWQANQAASCLLLPKMEFVREFLLIAKKNELSDKGFGTLYLDSQKCNLDKYYMVTSPLMNKYKVSRAVVRLRLKKLGYLNEEAYKKTNKLIQRDF